MQKIIIGVGGVGSALKLPARTYVTLQTHDATPTDYIEIIGFFGGPDV